MVEISLKGVEEFSVKKACGVIQKDKKCHNMTSIVYILILE